MFAWLNLDLNIIACMPAKMLCVRWEIHVVMLIVLVFQILLFSRKLYVLVGPSFHVTLMKLLIFSPHV